MSDLISRQAAIDAIGELRSCTLDEEAMWREIIGRIPSAQQEIIRCGDCKHRYVDGDNVRFNVCELNHNKVQGDDWFCADAERREDG